ncbi:hypothetical protein LXL04_034286 [Taraxacum kok-saghyz]
MEVEPFTKGSTVEVSSDEEGFYGAWYVATLVDIVDASPTKTRGSNKRNRDKKKVGYLVRYATLFKEDNVNEHLTETVHPSYVRPLPPLNLRRDNDNQLVVAEAETEEGNGGDFELYDVVDAYLRDGWWIGVVRKVIVDGEMKKYVVSFECPPEELEFEGSQVRYHVDWIKSRWKLRLQKTPNQESGDKKGTQTSNSNNASNNGVPLTPSKGALMTDSAYLTISPRLSAKKKSRSRKKAVTNVKTISGVNGSVEYRRTKRVVNIGEDEDLHENFHSSACVENSGSKGNTEDMVSEMEKSGEKTKNQDSLILEEEMITKETCETQDGNSQRKRKRRRLTRSQSERPNRSLEDNYERLFSDIDEITTELDEQPLSIWCQGLLHSPPVSKTHFSSSNIGSYWVYLENSGSTALEHEEPIAAPKPTMVNQSQTTENQHVWPFVKKSPIWATLESLELYQNLSQNPHFAPLLETKEDLREGLAIAHMVTFTNVVQRTTNLQWTDPTDVINNSLETLVDLEANGFDVGPVRARLDELLAKKHEVGRLEGEMKEAEKEVEKYNSENTAIDEEIKGLERMMREVEEKMAQAVALKKVKDEETMAVRSKLKVVSKRIVDWKVAFEELVGNPL